MAPYGSAIKAWPSGQIMATPMITRRGGYPVRYAAKNTGYVEGENVAIEVIE